MLWFFNWENNNEKTTCILLSFTHIAIRTEANNYEISKLKIILNAS